MALLRPSVPGLVCLVVVTAWICYAFMRVNYAILSLAITTYLVLLFAIGELPEPPVALHRVEATLLVGVIALSAQGFGLWVTRIWHRYNTAAAV
jgi:uncharacterized membrane protein YccC